MEGSSSYTCEVFGYHSTLEQNIQSFLDRQSPRRSKMINKQNLSTDTMAFTRKLVRRMCLLTMLPASFFTGFKHSIFFTLYKQARP